MKLLERETAPARRSGMMDAAVLASAGSIEIRQVPVPVPGPGEVRVRLFGCGVCASNLEPWAGPDWMHYPTAPGDLGHEGWGIVDEVGFDVGHLVPGEPVCALFQNSYAQYDVGPAEAVVKLGLDLGEGFFPGEPLGCAVNIARRSRVRAGETVAVVGVGFIGALVARLAAEQGARVIAISRREQALAVGSEMGAVAAIELRDHVEVAGEVHRLTDGRMCDCVVEATGKAGPLELAGRLTAMRGRLVIAGYHQDGPRLINMQDWNWKGIDVVNAHERSLQACVDGVRAAVELVRVGKLPFRQLITDVFPLSRLNDALDATRDRREGFFKAVVTMP